MATTSKTSSKTTAKTTSVPKGVVNVSQYNLGLSQRQAAQTPAPKTTTQKTSSGSKSTSSGAWYDNPALTNPNSPDYAGDQAMANLKNAPKETPMAVEDAGLTPIDTTQPSPEQVQVTPAINKPTQDQALANLRAGGLAGEDLAMAEKSLQSGYAREHALAVSGGQPSPTTRGQFGEVIDTSKLATSEKRITPQSPLDAFIQENPLMGGLIESMRDYFDPDNQRKSLREEYESMRADTGIEDLNLEAMNLKNIIEGTEDDIRLEVTKAGGFSTDSQVMALTNARNKQNIKNYNRLLDTIDSKEKMINTMIGLEQQDRQMTDQRFMNMFNMTAQVAQYQQQFTRDAKAQMQWLATQPGGYDALLLAAQDPFQKSLIDKTFGGVDALSTIARTAAQDRAKEQKLIDLQIANASKSLYDTGAGKPLTQPQSAALGYATRLVQATDVLNGLDEWSANNLRVGGDFLPNFLRSEDRQKYEQAERNFVNAVLRRESGAAISPSEFENARMQYFAVIGDTPDVIEQKKQNRILVTRNFLREGGQEDVDPTGLRVSPNGELIYITD